MRALGIVLASLITLGCSALVHGPDDEVACELRDDGLDPCLELGRVCANGFCRAREVCNGVDDDLDGVVDEGAESDADGDGFTWCGGGNSALADCNDEDAAIHPADPTRGIEAPEEICDGRDNQCDGRDVDLIEASNCTFPQQCSRSVGQCVERLCTYPEFRCAEGFQCVEGECRPGDCTLTGCAAPQVCDPLTRVCVDRRPIGAACETDAQCADQVCMPSREALGLELGLAAGGRAVCTRACCDNRDCPTGQACWAPGTGARGCIDVSVLEAGTHGAPENTERACSDRVACEPEQCLPARYEAYDRARSGFVCGSTTRPDRTVCRSNADCESGSCQLGREYWSWTSFGYIRSGICAAPCRTAADCRPYERGWNQSTEAQESDVQVAMGCLTARFGDTSDFTQICLTSLGAPTGSACTTDADCLENGCIAGVCRATCCSNSDCPGELCRPFVQGDHWTMRCAPALQVL